MLPGTPARGSCYNQRYQYFLCMQLYFIFRTANLRFMDPTIAATVIGVLMSVAFGAFATAFAWLRSDLIARLDKMDDKVEARFDKMDEKVDTRFERLEAKVDGLIMTLGRSGQLREPEDSDADD